MKISDIQKISNHISTKKHKYSQKEYLCKVEELKSCCMNFLDMTNEKIHVYMKMFNELIEEISLVIKNKFPNDNSVCFYNKMVKNHLKKYSSEPLLIFLKYIYTNDKYRQYIIEGNDVFFTKNKEIDNDKNIKEILMFKSYWNKLNDVDKDLIKNIMKTMVEICTNYVIDADNGNIVTNILLSYP